VRDALSAIEATLKPGHGRVDLFGFARSENGVGAAGAGLDAAARIGANVSLFGRGWVGEAWDLSGRSRAGEITAGVRGTW
jgi:hypothetical protein